jgi:hypothetical protein
MYSGNSPAFNAGVKWRESENAAAAGAAGAAGAAAGASASSGSQPQLTWAQIVKPPFFLDFSNFPGQQGFSYPGMGCEEDGYDDAFKDAFKNNSDSIALIIQSAFAESVATLGGGGGAGVATLGGGGGAGVATLGGGGGAGVATLGGGDGEIDDLSAKECEEHGIQTCSTKSTEYPQTELGVALGFFLIMMNPDIKPVFDARYIDQFLTKMTEENNKSTKIFECTRSANISSQIRFENYKQNFKGTIDSNGTRDEVELIKYINAFIHDFKLKHPNIKITKVFLKGKGANSNDTADVLAEGIVNGKRITISIDVKKTAGARKSNLSAKKILDKDSGKYWTSVVKPLQVKVLTGIPRIAKTMSDDQKTYIRQQCTIAFSDKQSPFWTAILEGMRMNANVVANAIINYLCPEPKYDLLYNFSGHELIRSKTPHDVASFSVSRCPRLELKKSGDPRQDLKMHFLCILAFKDQTKRCFDLQLMWKGNHHSPPFYILFEIDCDDYEKSAGKCIINKSTGPGKNVSKKKKGGSRKPKRKSLRKRNTQRRK